MKRRHGNAAPRVEAYNPIAELQPASPEQLTNLKREAARVWLAVIEGGSIAGYETSRADDETVKFTHREKNARFVGFSVSIQRANGEWTITDEQFRPTFETEGYFGRVMRTVTTMPISDETPMHNRSEICDPLEEGGLRPIEVASREVSLGVMPGLEAERLSFKLSQLDIAVPNSAA